MASEDELRKSMDKLRDALIPVIQQQAAQIAALTARLDALEAS